MSTKAELEILNAEAYTLLKECKEEILQNREDLKTAEVYLEVLQNFRILQDELLEMYRKAA